MTAEEKIEKIKNIISERNGITDSQEFGLTYSQAINYLDEIEDIVMEQIEKGDKLMKIVRRN